jgi:branched-chain amino acid transport system permease protein
MSTIVDILVFGASLSALYMLVAIGFTMIFSIGGIANLAHGAFLMAGAYIVFLLTGEGFPVLLGLIISVPLVMIGSVALYYIFFKPIEEETLTALIVTLLVGLILEELVGIFISHESRSIPAITDGVFRVFGTPVPYNRALAFVVSWACVGLVW